MESPTEDDARTSRFTDLESLIVHASTLPREIEQAWSAALDKVQKSPANEHLVADWHAVIDVLQQSVEDLGSETEAAGIDQELPEFPLSLESIAELSLSPTVSTGFIQTEVGRLYALVSLLEAWKAMNEPSGLTIKLLSGERQTWWEAGAFGLLRDRAELAQRCSREAEIARARVVGETPQPAIDAPGWEQTQLARKRLSDGDPEAALFHAHCALNEIDRSRQPEKSTADEKILSLVAEAVGEMIAGQPTRLGVTIPLAHAAIDIARRWGISIIHEGLPDALDG